MQTVKQFSIHIGTNDYKLNFNLKMAHKETHYKQKHTEKLDLLILFCKYSLAPQVSFTWAHLSDNIHFDFIKKGVEQDCLLNKI